MKILLLLSTFFNPDSSVAATNWQLLTTVSIQANLISTDNLGNCYMVRKDEVTKYTANGDSVNTQSFKWLGSISNIDASNSLRVMLFYKDLNQLLVLDNTLSVQGEPLKLEKVGFEYSTLFCQSPNNQNFWIYETGEFRLVRLDKNFKIINNSGNLTQVLGEEIDPNFMQEEGNYLYLNNPETGLLVFDMFGTYYKTIPLKGLDYFQVINGDVFYISQQQLHRYSSLDHNISKIDLPLKDAISFRIEKNRLFLLSPTQLSIFVIS